MNDELPEPKRPVKGDSAKQEPRRQLTTEMPQATVRECIRAIQHPGRRRLLRFLHEIGEARSPSEVAKALDAEVKSLTHHFKALKECNLIVLTDEQPKGGALEHFYVSTVQDNELVGILLEATKDEDQNEVAASSR